MQRKVIFTKETTRFILEALGKKTDEKGYVIHSNGDYVLDFDGKKFKPQKLIGIVNKHFITSNIQLISLGLSSKR